MKNNNKSKKVEKEVKELEDMTTVEKIKRIAFILVITGVVVVISFIGKYIYNIYTASQVSKALENVEIYDENKNELVSENVQRLINLKNENSDIVGWIRVDGTNINYPVLQSENNEYYKTHDYKKNVSGNGSIYVDSAYSFLMPSKNMTIHGVNNNNYVMFSELINYRNEEYMKNHKNIKFIDAENEYNYEVFALISCDDKKYEEFLKCEDVTNEEEFLRFKEYITQNTMLNKEYNDFSYNDEFITLVTTNGLLEEKSNILVIAKKSLILEVTFYGTC